MTGSTGTTSSSMGTTSTSTGIYRFGAARWPVDSSMVLILLGPLLLVMRGTATVHDCEEHEVELRNKTMRSK